jgi:hypothetical protein
MPLKKIRIHYPERKDQLMKCVCQNVFRQFAVKVADLHPLNPEELTLAEIEVAGGNHSFTKIFFAMQFRVMKIRKLYGLSHQIGVRETRRVYGEHRLTKEECMKGTIPADSIFFMWRSY